MEQIIAHVKQWVALYGLSVIGAVAILVLGSLAVKLLVSFIQKGMKRANMDETLVSFGGNFLRFILFAFVLVAALAQVGFQTSSIIAVLGAASLAIALAMQSNLANLAAGVLILIFRPFKLEDTIETAGTLGKVEEITITSTKLRLFDGKLAIMPNNKVFTDKLVNITAAEKRRIDLVVGIGYDDDLLHAKKVLMEIIEDEPRVLNDPAPTVRVMELADSSVNFAVRPWTNNADWWATKCDLTERIKLRLDAEGINIPYPQSDVHLYKQDPPSQTN